MRVVLSVPNDIPLPADVNATIIPLSLVGERYVQLFPAWKAGQPRLKPNAVIPLSRTSVPVEPDEALAALKHLLDSIDPQATGKLITNLAAGLDGTGEDLNAALKGLGTITETLGDKDEKVGAIIDHFDRLTATLASRDQTLGRVLDAFAVTTDALADERARDSKPAREPVVARDERLRPRVGTPREARPRPRRPEPHVAPGAGERGPARQSPRRRAASRVGPQPRRQGRPCRGLRPLAARPRSPRLV